MLPSALRAGGGIAVLDVRKGLRTPGVRYDAGAAVSTVSSFSGGDGGGKRHPAGTALPCWYGR
jgi:hypothetical protein